MTATATTMKYRPLLDNVLVEMDPPPKMAGSIHIPDAHQKNLRIGTVLAVGSGIHLKLWNKDDVKGRHERRYVEKPMPMTVGDRVLCTQYGGVELPHEQERHLIMFALNEIYAVLEEDPGARAECA